MGSGHLEVHVSEEVFQALNIRKNQIVVICLTVTSPQEMPATCFLMGTPAAIRDMVDAQILA